MLIFDENSQDIKNDSFQPNGIEDAKVYVCNQVETYAARLRAKVLNPISPYEAASWPIKQAEAMKVVEGGSSTVLSIEARARGITALELANKVLEKAQLLAGLEATIAGVSGFHRDTVNNLTTLDEVVRYYWGHYWPEL